MAALTLSIFFAILVVFFYVIGKNSYKKQKEKVEKIHNLEREGKLRHRMLENLYSFWQSREDLVINYATLRDISNKELDIDPETCWEIINSIKRDGLIDLKLDKDYVEVEITDAGIIYVEEVLSEDRKTRKRKK